MSFKYYNPGPEPGYNASGYEVDPWFRRNFYQADVMPPWQSDYVPPIECEPWPPRDYAEYVSNIYRADEEDRWLEPVESKPIRLLESRYTPPWKRQRVPEPSYTPVTEIESPVVREAAVRVEFGLSRLLQWVTVNGIQGIEDVVANILYSMEMIELKIEQDAAQCRKKLSAKLREAKKAAQAAQRNHPKLGLI